MKTEEGREGESSTVHRAYARASMYEWRKKGERQVECMSARVCVCVCEKERVVMHISPTWR